MSFRPFFQTIPVPASATAAGLVKGDGSTVSIAPDGTISVVGVTVAALTDAGPLALSDKDVVNRAGADYSTTQTSRVALFRRTPAGSRTAALPVTLTATDHDKNVILTGASGALTVDGTVADGFRTHIINTASGAASFSGITGLMGTTSLAAGAACTVMMAGATVYATATAVAAAVVASAYTTTLSATSGQTNAPVTMTFTPNGAWQSGQTITPTSTTLVGAFATVSNGTLTSGVIAPTSGSTTAVSVLFTPSSAAGVNGTLNSTPSSGLANTTGALAYSVVAALATAFTMTASATSGVTGAPFVITLTPTGGNWPNGVTIMLAQAGTNGSFTAGSGGTLSGSVLTPPSGATTACTVNFTPTTAGTATISATNSGTLTNPSNVTYTAAAIATAFTVTVSAANPARVTVTPTSGIWPTSITLTPSIVSGGTLAGAFGVITAAVAGSSAAAVFGFTPTSASGTSGAISVTSSPALTNTTGNVAYSVPAGSSYVAVSSGARVITLDARAASSIIGTGGTPVTTGTVATWKDATGNGASISATSTSGTGTYAAPTIVQNAKGSNALIYSGAGQYTQTNASGQSWPGTIGSAGFCIAMAFQVPLTGSQGQAGAVASYFASLGNGTSGSRIVFYTNASGAWGVYKWAVNSTANEITIASGNVPPNWTRLIIRYNPGASNTIDVWLNSTTKASVANTADNVLFDTIILGGLGANYCYFGEVQIFSGLPSDADCVSLMNDMTTAWGT